MSGSTRRVVITGFMGAGKSTLARALAARLGGRMLDLDFIIAERERRTVPALLREEGEQKFREAETRALRVVLENGAAQVIALGGGAWMRAENRALIAAHDCLTVWLDAPFDLCWQRIAGSATERPLAANQAEAARLYEARLETYALAELRLAARPEKSAGELAAEIVSALERGAA